MLTIYFYYGTFDISKIDPSYIYGIFCCCIDIYPTTYCSQLFAF
ncbi:hypothetical protein BN136_2765 [Cronobacter universalis NCTC 9529]|nr:hypothetical protein BN136_2765 [Cronobacter universalis NCTC 9529]